MGDEPVGGDDESLEETKSKNLTMKTRTWLALEDRYPHLLEDQERVRAAVQEVLENSDSSAVDETE